MSNPFRWIAIGLALTTSGCAATGGGDMMPRYYDRPATAPTYSPRDQGPAPDAYATRDPQAQAPSEAPSQGAYPYPRDPNNGSAYTPPPYRPDLVPGAVATRPQPEPPRAGYGASNGYAPPRYADWAEEDYYYRIGPGDQLALRFLLNPDLNGPAIVGPDGRGVFPLVSAVKVADLTVEQANDVLSQAYGQVLRRPQVEVLITAYGSAQIYVGGEVRNPGAIPIKGQLTTAQAILTAGGMLPTARTGRIVVLRQRPDGQLLMKEVDLKAYLNRGQAQTDIAILPGDLIFVPRSKIAEVDLFVEQYINGVLPFSRSVGYSVNRGNRF